MRTNPPIKRRKKASLEEKQAEMLLAKADCFAEKYKESILFFLRGEDPLKYANEDGVKAVLRLCCRALGISFQEAQRSMYIAQKVRQI